MPVPISKKQCTSLVEILNRLKENNTHLLSDSAKTQRTESDDERDLFLKEIDDKCALLLKPISFPKSKTVEKKTRKLKRISKENKCPDSELALFRPQKNLKSIVKGFKKTIAKHSTKPDIKLQTRFEIKNEIFKPLKLEAVSPVATPLRVGSPELFTSQDYCEPLLLTASLPSNNENLLSQPIKRRLSSSPVTKLNPSPIGKRSKYNIQTESDPDMHDYRHQLSYKNDNNSGGGYIVKNEEVEENLINTYYTQQQKYLGGSSNSIATLCNIGNSCYLNSVIYTLRFAPYFPHKLHHLVDDMRQVYQKIGQHKLKSSSLGRNVSGLQGQSGRSWSSKDLASLGGIGSTNGHESASKNNRQIATEKLHELLQSLHRNESVDSGEPFHAGTFLQAIQDVSSIFEGNQQQDAHELLMCILDSVRETCSSLIKTINEHPEVVSDSRRNILPDNELTSPPPQSQTQSLKSIFSRNRKRKDTFKFSGKTSSPMKESNADAAVASNDITAGGDFNVKSSLHSLTNETSDSDLTDKEKINERIRKLGLDFFREDFEGITLSTTKCLTCESVTEQKETMVDISIPISNESNQPVDPQLFFQNSCITQEYFRVENHYRCDKCCGYTEAIRSISFEVLPRLLVLHIKRFSGGMEKISSYSPTPFVLKCFCNKCYKKRDEDKLHVYKLYSVITHVGATMSVGHYIAYTCSLDIYNEYVNCANDKRRLSLSNSQTASSGSGQQNQSTIGGTEKNTGLMKKLIYGRNKASSSGDMSKSIKPINGLSKMMINGIEKLSLNSEKNSSSNAHIHANGTTSAPVTPPKTVCPSANCCGIYVKNFTSIVENYHNNQANVQPEKTTHENGVSPENENGYHSNGTSKPSPNDINQKIWYMCDDDKIKIMTQREFEEALSRNQKVMITPYLLFYARYDAQTINRTDSD